jgi:hypothetical protein
VADAVCWRIFRDRQPTVEVPLDVLMRALAKARVEYQRHGSDCTDKEYECWREFEALHHYLPDDAEWLAAGMTR